MRDFASSNSVGTLAESCSVCSFHSSTAFLRLSTLLSSAQLASLNAAFGFAAADGGVGVSEAGEEPRELPALNRTGLACLGSLRAAFDFAALRAGVRATEVREGRGEMAALHRTSMENFLAS